MSAIPVKPGDAIPLARVVQDIGRWPLRTLEAGETLFLEGAPIRTVDVVVSGLVRAYRMTCDGRRHICRFIAPGGVLDIGSGPLHRSTAEAVTMAHVQSCPRGALLNAASDDVLRQKAISDELSNQLDEHERSQMRIARLCAEERVADFLLQWLETWGAAPNGTCDIPMSRLDIADHLGLTLETVSRVLNLMNRRGVIQLVDPHHFRIRQKGVLTRLASGDREALSSAA